MGNHKQREGGWPARRGPLTALFTMKGGSSPASEKGLGIEAPKDFDQRRHEPGPSCLMTGADASAIVAVEIFVEQQVIAPIRIALELLGSPEHRPPAGLIAQEDPGQPIGDLAGDLEQVHQVARAGGTLDLEVVPV